MLKSFKKYIAKNQLFEAHHKLLIAVSGGMDSVVLLHLVNQLPNQCAIAHCNFHLRGEDSDKDEKLVRELAHQYGIDCWVENFATEEYALQKGISIEMAARELRYEWFERLRLEKEYDYLLVAHHADDSIETFLLNMSRGTGIRGLTGIKAKKQNIIRPLLSFHRNEIETYAMQNDLDYRLDGSNNDTQIQRNYIRHEIIPRLALNRPTFRRNMMRTIQNLHKAELVFSEKVQEVKDILLINEDGLLKISIEQLQDLNYYDLYLFEFLYPLGFNDAICDEIVEAIEGISGKQFFSKTHRLIVDRDYLIIDEISEREGADLFYIEEEQNSVFEPINLELANYDAASFKLIRDRNIACLDYDKVSRPLIIRKWRQGDYFKPLGMSGFKKISDFFVDQKFSIPEKESTWLLTSGKNIVWIIGHRIDERYKVSDSTKKVLVIKYQK